MEFEEMKNLWENQSQTLDLNRHTLSDVRSLALKKQTKIFQVSEVIGLGIAYLLAGMLVYHFIGLDLWF